LATGFEDIGGYALAFINAAAFLEDKIFQVYWTGARYRLGHQLEGALASGYSYSTYMNPTIGLRYAC
jgi:hypothetical protein